MRRYIETYLASIRMAIQEQIQYRVANYFYMIGMVAEPVIYLVVWSTVARAQGGEVGGYTPAAFAAYYIVWTLVRNMNIVFTPYGWEGYIQSGRLSYELLRPIHPIHNFIAFFAGWKVVVILFWLPLAAVLAFIFKPDLTFTWVEVVVFFFAIWGAYLIRTMLLAVLGMISFWTTRVSAIYELYFALELILSGRLVPMGLMPEWVQRIAGYLPFQWAFGYPIESLVGQLPASELWGGLLMQALWITGLTGLVALIWRVGVKKYSAVGN